MNKDIVRFIKKCLQKDIITPSQTNTMIDLLELEERASDIWQWAKYYFPEKFTSEFCEELHGYLFSIRNEDLTSTLAPRSHGKTIISCFLIPMYLALHDDKYKHFLNVQSTATKATNVNIAIKTEFETNEKLIKDYGNMIGDKWTEKQFILSNGAIFSAAGAGESIRGINVKSIRPDYIVVDDLYSEDDINQPKRIKKLNQWFWSTLYPARANDRKCAIHIQGTAIGRDDLMHSLKESKNAQFKKFKAIKNESKKQTLWFDYEKLLEDKENMGTIIFSREYQNELRDDETAIIKESWIQSYSGTVPKDETIKYFICGIDPAIGEKETNDCTGKIACFISKNKNFYICDARNARLSFNKNLEDIKDFHNKHNFKQVRIECIAAFKVFAQELRRTTGIPVKEIKYVKDKITRLENISHYFENGKVFISEQIPKRVRDELIYQLINNHPVHDDLRDALVLCLEEPKSTGVAAIF